VFFQKNFLLPIWFLLFSFPLLSETVLLKDGTSKVGKVVNQNRDIVQLKLSDNSIISITKSKILKVIYKDLSPKEATKVFQDETKKLKKDELNANANSKKNSSTPEPLGILGDPLFLDGLKAQNEQILLLTDEVVSLSKQVEEQKTKIEKLEKYSFGEGPKIVRWDVVKRSSVLPGWGQFYWNEPVWGSIYSSLFVASLVHYNQSW
jgi:hypothetical protein